MADFARALELGAKKRGNNNNENNIGNTTNIIGVKLSMTKANLIRSQRITEEYEKIDRELQKIIRRLKECHTIVTRRPKEISENQEIINALSQKASLTNRNQTDLNKFIAENIKLKNDIQGCHLETEGLLDKKKKLETELFFKKKWYDEEQSLGPFNVPKAKATTFQGPQQQKKSIAGGRARTRRSRRQTRKK
jgi:hypothetical protein